MPRANRYIQPGCLYHLTHRCHDRRFLFRFARDRNEYRKRLRASLKQSPVSLLWGQGWGRTTFSHVDATTCPESRVNIR